ncbi:hypothetical protein SLA2020_501060 [Shorea laevis]
MVMTQAQRQLGWVLGGGMSCLVESDGMVGWRYETGVLLSMEVDGWQGELLIGVDERQQLLMVLTNLSILKGVRCVAMMACLLFVGGWLGVEAVNGRCLGGVSGGVPPWVKKRAGCEVEIQISRAKK